MTSIKILHIKMPYMMLLDGSKPFNLKKYLYFLLMAMDLFWLILLFFI
jgi:hypothetical protein